MVHTAELTYKPTRILYQKFISLPTTRSWEQDDRFPYVNKSLSEYGISYIKARIANYDRYTYYEFVMRINFKRLIERNDRMDIMHEDDLGKVYDAFNDYMRQLMPEEQDAMPRLTDWYVNRIDYCVNVKTQNVSEYINLLQKSTIPYCYRLKHDENRNYTHKSGSLYLVSTAKKKNRSTTIDFYDKYDEVKKKYDNGDSHVTAEVLEQSRDILRLEVQCHKAKTGRIAAKYGFDDGKKLINFLQMRICYDVIEEAINRVTKDATFQRKRIAFQMISQLNCTSAKKERLKQLITDVGRQWQSITKVREQYSAEGIMTESTFDSYLKYLELHNINAVTISDNKHLDGKTLAEGLPSLYSIFNNTVYGVM